MITCSFEDGKKTNLRHAVVDCIVLRNNEILLARRASELLEGGKWSLPGGFVRRDETLLQAVEREVLEETGFKIKDLTLLRIIDNPNRPQEDRQNIAFVYFCHADTKVGEVDWESEEQKWFKLDSIPLKGEIAFDHHEDVELYLKYLKEQFSVKVRSKLKPHKD